MSARSERLSIEGPVGALQAVVEEPDDFTGPDGREKPA